MQHANRHRVIVGVLAVCAAVGGSASLATAARGPFVYVANSKSDGISEYSALPRDSGALTPLTPARVRSGSFPYGIAVDPQAQSVYAADVDSNEVSQYTINPNTGGVRLGICRNGGESRTDASRIRSVEARP